MAVGDVHRYGNGTEYVETDGGPNMYGQCYVCGKPAIAALERLISSIRCGRCWADQHQLLPGQRFYRSQVAWQQEQQMKKESP